MSDESDKPNVGVMPAFPSHFINTSARPLLGLDGAEIEPGDEVYYAGISVRDYFAAASRFANEQEIDESLGGRLIGRVCPPYKADARAHFAWLAEVNATLRYIDADAMLKARGAK